MDATQPSNLGLPTPLPGPHDPSQAQTPAAGQAMAAAMSPNPLQPLAGPPTALAASPLAGNTAALDQEWVDKAKGIIEKTKGDPFLQSRELSKAKAGYLKARYNKDLKIIEDSA